jgi:hypothetical protein
MFVLPSHMRQQFPDEFNSLLEEFGRFSRCSLVAFSEPPKVKVLAVKVFGGFFPRTVNFGFFDL